MNDNGVRAALAAMAGLRQRCVFCGDSLASEIEHFRPKSKYPDAMFRWSNLMWACNHCNRKKGTRFPVDDSGAPLLIDPTRQDPWDHLYFHHGTGYLVARYLAELNGPDPYGEATTAEDWLPINSEAITEGRKVSWRQLRRAVEGFLASSEPNADAQARVVESFRDCTHPEIVRWVLDREGGAEMPFATLAQREPVVWRELQALSV